jgi:hypothetical protein
MAEVEIRLLAVGARLAADLALLPEPARPRDIPGEWEQLAATFAESARRIVAERGDGQPDLVRPLGRPGIAGQPQSGCR